METKINQVRQLMGEQNYRAAMRIAKGFTRTISPDEKAQITRAFECFNNAEFYRSVGKDPDAEICKGIDIMKRVYAI